MNHKIRILIAEHDEHDVELLEYELKHSGINYESLIVKDESNFRRALKNFTPDLVLCDFTFPSFDGLTAFSIKDEVSPETPFIFVTGTIGEEKSVELIKNGVTDFVLKDKLFSVAIKVKRALKEAKDKFQKATMEQALRESEAHLVEAQKLAKMGSWYFDFKADILTWSAELYNIFGADKNTFTETYSSFVHLVDEADRGLVMQTSINTQKTGEPFTIEYNITTFKGEKRIIQEHGYGQLNEQGEVTRLFGTAQDITERKQAEEQVLHTEKRFRALIEKSADMKLLATRDGILQYCSPSITKQLGYSLEELLDVNVFNFIHHDDIAIFLTERNKILLTPGKSFHYKNRLLHKNGNWIWCEGTLTNLLDEPGIEAMVSNFRDITEKMELEKQKEFDTNNLAALINNSDDLMWSIDIDYRLITFNQSFANTLHRLSGRIIKKGTNIFESGFALEQVDHFKNLFERTFNGEIFTQVEHILNPIENWVEVSYNPIRAGQKIVGVACHSRNITEQKKAEKAQIESHNLIQTIYSASMDAVIIIDTMGCIVKWDNKSAILFGWIENEVLGKKLSEVIIPLRYRELHEMGIAQYLTTGAGPVMNKTIDVCALKKNAKEFDISLCITPTQLNGVTHFIGFIRDNSEKKIAEMKLQKSDAFNRGVLNSLSSHIAVIDAAGKIVAVNEAWTRFAIENGETKLQRTDVGSNYFEVCENSAMSGDDIAREALLGMMDVMNEEKKDYYLEYPCNSADKQRWFAMCAMKFDGGEPMVVVSHEDISERIQAIENLRQSEKISKEAQAIAHLGNWEINFESGIARWSEEACRIYGISIDEKDEQSYATWLSFVHPDDVDIILKASRESQKTLNDTILFHRIVLKDGTIKHINSKYKYKIGQDGVPIGLYGVAHDVTERKIAELKLETQNRDLQKTNFELDRFVYSVSHDMRSPLTSVLGLVGFIEEESLEPDTLEHAGMIRKSINRLDGFLKNILSYSRNNRVALGVEEIPVQKLANEIVDSLSNMEDAAGISFEVAIDEKQAFFSDYQRFSTIMENLISNAIKYHDHNKSGRYIKIDGKVDKQELVLTVEDNGLGIDEEHHEKIFDMFYRISSIMPGSGLGLYIVREIVEQLKGEITCTSQPGKGTIFKIILKNLA